MGGRTLAIGHILGDLAALSRRETGPAGVAIRAEARTAAGSTPRWRRPSSTGQRA